MRDVYTGADMCISAASAPDGQTGLPFRRVPVLLTPIAVSLPGNLSFATAPKPCQYLSYLQNTTTRNPSVLSTRTREPLNQRAWAVQNYPCRKKSCTSRRLVCIGTDEETVEDTGVHACSRPVKIGCDEHGTDSFLDRLGPYLDDQAILLGALQYNTDSNPVWFEGICVVRHPDYEIGRFCGLDSRFGHITKGNQSLVGSRNVSVRYNHNHSMV